MQICPTTTAFNYADSPEHEGAGFFLVLTLRSGAVFRGSCHPPANGLIRMYPTPDRETPAFIRLDDVSGAEVEWKRFCDLKGLSF